LNDNEKGDTMKKIIVMGLMVFLGNCEVGWGSSNCANGDLPGSSGFYFPIMPADVDDTHATVITPSLDDFGVLTTTYDGGAEITYSWEAVTSAGGGPAYCGVQVITLGGSVTTESPASLWANVTAGPFSLGVTPPSVSVGSVTLTGFGLGGAAQECRTYSGGVAEVVGTLSVYFVTTIEDCYGYSSSTSLEGGSWVNNGDIWWLWTYCGPLMTNDT
jgi:hypothetical protein